MVYRVTYFKKEEDGWAIYWETHECNWLSEVNVIVGNGLEEGYMVVVEKIKKE